MRIIDENMIRNNIRITDIMDILDILDNISNLVSRDIMDIMHIMHIIDNMDILGFIDIMKIMNITSEPLTLSGAALQTPWASHWVQPFENIFQNNVSPNGFRWRPDF